ncbi:MAG: hypothetical protein LBQ83_02610 [Candidatus Margulisbacteria bacterium]|jgi:hypothetical protein|nr:hypothetical protein [Candidatus Margulisiibacteriota bacterium]
MASNYTGNYTGISAGGQMKAADVTDALNKMEKVEYKVTELSSSSTDTQYPSAKAVYTGLAAKAAASDVSALSGTVTALQTTVSGLQDKLPAGTILMYDGSGWENNKTLVGWYKCDGNNGTPNLTNLFIRGGASSGGSGGADSQSITLTTANLPGHSHSVTDAGHSHTVTDSGHTHTDSGHSHSHTHDTHTGSVQGYDAGNTNIFGNASGVFSASGNANRQQSSDGGARDAYYKLSLSAGHSTDSTSGKAAISSNATGITIDSKTTGISLGNTGSGAAFTVNTVPAYYALIYIKKVA